MADRLLGRATGISGGNGAPAIIPGKLQAAEEEMDLGVVGLAAAAAGV